MNLVSRFLEQRNKIPSQACCRMCCGICMLWIPLASKNPRPLQRRQIQKNHREGGSSAELVARDATVQINKIRRSSEIATTAIHKTIHKDFCLPSKSHFYNLPISSPGCCLTSRSFSYTLQKLGVFGAGAQPIDLKGKINRKSWFCLGFSWFFLVQKARQRMKRRRACRGKTVLAFENQLINQKALISFSQSRTLRALAR